jgi:hypothetical protein
VVISDHSNGMGTISEIKADNPEMMADATLKRWHEMFAKGWAEANKALFELIAAQVGEDHRRQAAGHSSQRQSLQFSIDTVAGATTDPVSSACAIA